MGDITDVPQQEYLLGDITNVPQQVYLLGDITNVPQQSVLRWNIPNDIQLKVSTCQGINFANLFWNPYIFLNPLKKMGLEEKNMV